MVAAGLERVRMELGLLRRILLYFLQLLLLVCLGLSNQDAVDALNEVRGLRILSVMLTGGLSTLALPVQVSLRHHLHVVRLVYCLPIWRSRRFRFLHGRSRAVTLLVVN